MEDDATLLRRFEGAELTPEEWHHREHIRLAYLYLVQCSFGEALDRMRRGLKRLNTAQNVPDTLERGYHETLTRGWMQLVQAELQQHGPAANSDAFLDAHCHLSARRALYFFYSRARLRSAEAKRDFIEPDLAPLPVYREPPL